MSRLKTKALRRKCPTFAFMTKQNDIK